MAAMEHRVSGMVEGTADLTPEELLLLWRLAMQLPRCDSVVSLEEAVFQTTGRSPPSPALQKAIEATVAAAIDAVRDRERLRDLAICDPLTGLPNRRFMEEELDRQIHLMAHLGQPMAVAMLDLDSFRICNDTHGHLAGDLVLRSLAVLLQGFRRGSDVPCRYGGEEFTVIMPTTDAAAAVARLELFRRRFAALGIHHEGRLLRPVTASIGVAEFPTHGGTAMAVLAAADAALYRAKRAGRNRICLANSADFSIKNSPPAGRYQR